jgi:hypothetical protein
MTKDPAGHSSGARRDDNRALDALQADFLRQRLAPAIERGDDVTAERLRKKLDFALNGPAA